MTDAPSRHDDDLAYLKRLAVAGRGEPAPFLLLIAVFGGAYGFALLAILAGVMIEGLPKPGSPVEGPISNFVGRWAIITSHLAFFGTLIWTAWRTLGPNRVRLSRTASATWSASFVALIVTYIVFRIYTRDEPFTDAVHTSPVMLSIILVLWGAAWWITALSSDRRWLFLVAVGSFAAAGGLAWSRLESPIALPIICASLIFLAFVPAVLLIREKRR